MSEIVELVNKKNEITIITADLGNLEDMSEQWKTLQKYIKTAFWITFFGYSAPKYDKGVIKLLYIQLKFNLYYIESTNSFSLTLFLHYIILIQIGIISFIRFNILKGIFTKIRR